MIMPVWAQYSYKNANRITPVGATMTYTTAIV